MTDNIPCLRFIVCIRSHFASGRSAIKMPVAQALRAALTQNLFHDGMTDVFLMFS